MRGLIPNILPQPHQNIDKDFRLPLLVLFQAIFISSIIVTNVIGVKVMTFAGFNFTAGIITYAVVFLMTDVISEVWGRRVSYYTVVLGFIGSLFSLIFIQLAVLSEPAPFWTEQQEAYAQTLGGVWIIIFASMIAYLIAQFNDVWLFHRVRALTRAKHLWLRNTLSTVISQTIDTVVFVFVAFGPFGFNISSPELYAIVLGQLVAKYVLAVIDTPIAYILVHLIGGPRRGAHEH